MQWRTLVCGLVFGVIWMTALAMVPWAIGRGIDDGIVGGGDSDLVRWALILCALSLLIGLGGAARRWFAVQNWLEARCARSSSRTRPSPPAGRRSPGTTPPEMW